MSILLPEVAKTWDVAKPFQVEDARFLAQHGKTVLGHKTGLGKTFISMMAMGEWDDAKSALIVGTLSSAAVWERQLQRWCGVKPTFMQGGGDLGWKRAISGEPGIYTTTYASYRYYMKGVPRHKIHFDILANDELHRTMRHYHTEIYKAMTRLSFEHYIGCSATWASRGPQDCWPILHLVNGKLFPSYWRFVNTWCHVEDGQFGKEIFGVRNVERLRELLRSGYYRMRTWPEVGGQFRDGNSELPVVRRRVKLPMTKQQAKLYTDLENDMYAELGDTRIVTPNSLAKLTRCLQMSVSPKILFPEAENGAAVDYLVDQVADDPHTVIFCPFKEGLQVMKAALIKDGYPEGKIFILQGGTHPTKINELVDKWKRLAGVMLSTIDFAQSFDLDTTFNAWMLGFDWDPNDNEQAEGRLRRLDSEIQIPCMVNYIIVEGSAYERVEEVVDGKYITTKAFLEGHRAQRVGEI